MTQEQKKQVLYTYYLSVLTDLIVDYPNVDMDVALIKIKENFESGKIGDDDVEVFYKYGGIDNPNAYDDIYKDILKMVGLYKYKRDEIYKEKERYENVTTQYLRVLNKYLKDKNKLSRYDKAKDIIIDQAQRNKKFGEFLQYVNNGNFLYQFPEAVDKHIYEELKILLKNRI